MRTMVDKEVSLDHLFRRYIRLIHPTSHSL